MQTAAVDGQKNDVCLVAVTETHHKQLSPSIRETNCRALTMHWARLSSSHPTRADWIWRCHTHAHTRTSTGDQLAGSTTMRSVSVKQRKKFTFATASLSNVCHVESTASTSKSMSVARVRLRAQFIFTPIDKRCVCVCVRARSAQTRTLAGHWASLHLLSPSERLGSSVDAKPHICVWLLAQLRSCASLA